MNHNETVYIGNKILKPGDHFVLVQGSLQTMGCASTEIFIQGGGQCQLFAPLGYTIKKYHRPDPVIFYNGSTFIRSDCETDEGMISYVNLVPVEVKVYEKDGKQFFPEFGVPVKRKYR